MNQLRTLFASRAFRIGAVVVLVLLVLWYFRRDIQRFTATDFGDFDGAQPNEERKRYLEALARRVHEAIYGFTTWTFRAELLAEVNQLNHEELRYLARFYEDALTRGEESLYEDVTDEMLPNTNEDEALAATLNQLGLF